MLLLYDKQINSHSIVSYRFSQVTIRARHGLRHETGVRRVIRRAFVEGDDEEFTELLDDALDRAEARARSPETPRRRLPPPCPCAREWTSRSPYRSTSEWRSSIDHARRSPRLDARAATASAFVLVATDAPRSAPLNVNTSLHDTRLNKFHVFWHAGGFKGAKPRIVDV